MSNSKRHKGRNGAQKGEGRPSGKDRSGHESSRGKKKQTLADLSREMPSEDDLVNYEEILSKQDSDRSRAIMGAALIEQALTVAIRSRLADPGDMITKSWFEGENAPFATFAAKIKLGRALAIYADKTEMKLNIIKNIRNVFAHCSIPIDFTHPIITAESAKLGTRDTHEGGAILYCAACITYSKMLIKDAFEQGGKPLEISLP